MGATRGHDLKSFKKRVNLDAGKFSFGNRVCDDWNRLQPAGVGVQWGKCRPLNEFKGNLDHYFRDNRGFK